MKTGTDEQLIRRVADGDPASLATLFERHHLDVYRYFMHMLRHAALCEDLVQEVFLKMLRKAGSFRGDGSFRGWMFNIARNVARDSLRKRKRLAEEPLDEAALQPLTRDESSAEQCAAGKQKVALVLQAMARLPAKAQEVIWLGRFEFDSYEELGQALNCSAGTARVRMHRAMSLLSTTYVSVHGVPIDG